MKKLFTRMLFASAFILMGIQINAQSTCMLTAGTLTPPEGVEVNPDTGNYEICSDDPNAILDYAQLMPPADASAAELPNYDYLVEVIYPGETDPALLLVTPEGIVNIFDPLGNGVFPPVGPGGEITVTGFGYDLDGVNGLLAVAAPLCGTPLLPLSDEACTTLNALNDAGGAQNLIEIFALAEALVGPISSIQSAIETIAAVDVQAAGLLGSGVCYAVTNWSDIAVQAIPPSDNGTPDDTSDDILSNVEENWAGPAYSIHIIDCFECATTLGTVTPPAETTIEWLGSVEAAVVDGNALQEDGYITLVAITTDLDDTDEIFYDLVAASEDGFYDFSLPIPGFDDTFLPPGTYNFQVLNIYFPDFNTLEALNGEEILQLIEDGVICADLDVPGYTVTYLGEVVFDCPDLEANIGDECDDNDAMTENDMLNDNCACAGTLIEVECIADYGIVGAPDVTTVEFGGTVLAPTLDGQTTDEGYIQVFLITTDADPTDEIIYDIVSISFDGSVNFSDPSPVSFTLLPAGTYNVHSLSFQGTIDELLALGVTSVEAALVAIDAGLACADLEVPGYQIIQLEEVVVDCPELDANIGDTCDDGNENTENDAVNADCVCMGEEIVVETPIVFDLAVDCDTATSLSDVTVTVTGGSGNENDLYTITQDGAGTEYIYVEGGIVLSLQVADGGMVSLSAVDSEGNTGELNYGPVGCVKCPVVEIENVIACSNDMVSVDVNVDVPSGSADVNFVTLIVVHNGSDFEIGDEVYYSGTETSFEIPADVASNTDYVVTAITAQDQDEDGMPDETDACYVSSLISGLFVALDPITITETTNVCTNALAQEEVAWTIDGGLPAYDADEMYTLAGVLNTMASAGVETDHVVLSDGTAYTLLATDGNGCSAEFSADVNCIKTAIELIAFDGEVLSNGNELSWTTASEYENDYFMLERSFNGFDFETIASIDGNGTSSTTIEYSYLDTEVTNGDAYYRLIEVDYNGVVTTHNEIVLLTRNVVNEVVVSFVPNPTDNFVVLSIEGNTSQVEITIIDIAGKTLKTFNTTSNSISLDLGNYATGTYFVQVSNENFNSVSRIVKR